MHSNKNVLLPLFIYNYYLDKKIKLPNNSPMHRQKYSNLLLISNSTTVHKG